MSLIMLTYLFVGVWKFNLHQELQPCVSIFFYSKPKSFSYRVLHTWVLPISLLCITWRISGTLAWSRSCTTSEQFYEFCYLDKIFYVDKINGLYYRTQSYWTEDINCFLIISWALIYPVFFSWSRVWRHSSRSWWWRWGWSRRWWWGWRGWGPGSGATQSPASGQGQASTATRPSRWGHSP